MTYAQILQNYTKNVEFSTENWIYYLAQQLYSGKDELSCTRLQVWVGYIIACMSIHETCNRLYYPFTHYQWELIPLLHHPPNLKKKKFWQLKYNHIVPRVTVD